MYLVRVMNEEIRKYFAEIGRKGGQVTSEAKTRANKIKARLPRKARRRNVEKIVAQVNQAG